RHGMELDWLARRVLRGWREGRGDHRQEIAEEIALAHRMTLAQLHEHCRDPDLVRVRNAIYYEIRLRLGASLPEIGRTMRRDHTTVLHGIRKHAQVTGRILPLGISERGAAQ
ncbi:MAG: helix-turn-helix domain-containing protein, partial [Roseibium sp.]